MKLAILWSISLKSKNMKKNNVGFMVFEDSGNSPLSYGACEKWFAKYERAVNYALKVIKKNTYKNEYCSVMIYELPKEQINKTREILVGNIKFYWTNHYLIKNP